jgi:hypothetical protein
MAQTHLAGAIWTSAAATSLTPSLATPLSSTTVNPSPAQGKLPTNYGR